MSGLPRLCRPRGYGTRMGNETPKQFLQLGDVPLLVHALRVLRVKPRDFRNRSWSFPEDADDVLSGTSSCRRSPFPKSARSPPAEPGGRIRSGTDCRPSMSGPRSSWSMIAVRPFVTGAMVEDVVDERQDPWRGHRGDPSTRYGEAGGFRTGWSTQPLTGSGSGRPKPRKPLTSSCCGKRTGQAGSPAWRRRMTRFWSSGSGIGLPSSTAVRKTSK